MIAALYVQTGGVYYGIPGVDPWDEVRDARTYAGPWPVVAHPPCARWSCLAGLVQSRYPHLRKGEDGGSFKSALAAVRTFGGVLEHPARTRAWAAHDLPMPPAFGWARTFDGAWVCEVAQAVYGHRARKLTWLYYTGDAPPPTLDWRKPATNISVSYCRNHGGTQNRMNRAEASRTPILFRDLLLSIARGAVSNA